MKHKGGMKRVKHRGNEGGLRGAMDETQGGNEEGLQGQWMTHRGLRQWMKHQKRNEGG